MPSKAKKAKVKAPKVSTLQEVRANINPQLCKTFNPAKHKWDKLWLAEPKFDGLRCIVVVETINNVRLIRPYSRNGKPLWNMEKIVEEIASTEGTDYILDGEVYTKDWNLSMGIVKRSTQTHPDQDKLRYHIWDCILLDEWNAGKSSVPTVSRQLRLWPLLDKEYVKVVVGQLIGSQEELDYVYTDFLTKGFEGAVIKHPQGIYECGRRSPNWLKVKPWADADLTIVGAYAGEGKHIGRVGGLVLEGKAEWNGYIFDVHTECGTGFTDEERELFQGLWDKGTLNGRIVEIKFQSIAEDTGACRFPVYNRLRTDKE